MARGIKMTQQNHRGEARPGNSDSEKRPKLFDDSIVSGPDVIRRLRGDEQTMTLPVSILISSKEEQDLIDGYRFGRNSYAVRPVDFVEFAEAVTDVGLYRLAVNEPPPTRA